MICTPRGPADWQEGFWCRLRLAPAHRGVRTGRAWGRSAAQGSEHPGAKTTGPRASLPITVPERASMLEACLPSE